MRSAEICWIVDWVIQDGRLRVEAFVSQRIAVGNRALAEELADDVELLTVQNAAF
jgi:hypothetical protein